MESKTKKAKYSLRVQEPAIIRLFRLLLIAAVWLAAWAPTGAIAQQAQEDGWPMAGSNPQRTSWTPEEVRGDLKPEWFQHFDAYIPQRVQIVASGGRLFLSTAKGLYALNAADGKQLWFYPTSLPLGHSPTLSGGVLYVGGFDNQIHAINAATGAKLWTFRAGAGFQTNPLVVEGKVFAGSRDGVFYALDAASGALAWKFQTGGPILFSAAYAGGTLFFAANDNHAYALRAADGALQWKSDKLPGHGFHSFWPVVAGDYVVFPGSYNYRYLEPFPGPHTELEREGAFPVKTKGAPLGPEGQESGPWISGAKTMRLDGAIQYLEQYPHRRTYFVLKRSNGTEYTFDSDGDGKPEYAPFLWFGTHSGTRNPPAVSQNGVLYQSTPLYYDPWIPRGRITGWKFGTSLVTMPPGSSTAVDEPLSYAIGGNVIYFKRCCDRLAGAGELTVSSGTAADAQSWLYFNEGGKNLRAALPELFDKGWNFAYWKHGDSSPPLPYRGRVYIIVNNAIVAFSPTGRSFSYKDSDLGELTGMEATDIERSQTLAGLTTRLTAGSADWPLLITQESYYNTETSQASRGRYFPLFEVSIPGQTPGSLSVETGKFGGKFTQGFGGGTLEAWTSQIAPATLFHTAAAAYRLNGALTGIAYPTTSGVQVATGTSNIDGASLSEGWLLAWDSSPSHRWMPVLISMEKRPAQIALSAAGLTLTYSGSAGHLALGPLYGMQSPRSSEAQSWPGSGIPADTQARIRVMDRLARAFPIAGQDNWRIEGSDAIYTASYTFREFTGSWNTTPLRMAYLPPRLALAASGQSPIQIEGTLADLTFVTPLGRAAGIQNQSNLSVRLPGVAALWRSAPPAAGQPAGGEALQARLVVEVERILAAGHLRPGYGIVGIWEAKSNNRIGDTLVDYWHNPADTVYTLAMALPYLSSDLRAQVLVYLQNEVQHYPLHTTGHIGWRDGANRDYFDLPPEVLSAAANIGPGSGSSFWKLPPQNFYALWLYARETGNAAQLFSQAKDKLNLNPQFKNSTPYVLNSYLAGYIGYLRLAALAGAGSQADVENILLDLLVTRAALSKYPEALQHTGFEYGGYQWSVRQFAPVPHDTLFVPTTSGSVWSQLPLYGFKIEVLYGLSGAATGGDYYFGIDFVNLVPETASFLRQYAPQESYRAVESYTTRAPYWFVAKAAETGGEGVFQPLYDRAAIFQAKAWIIGLSRTELTSYLDVSATRIGDLFFIQNMIAALGQDGSTGPLPAPPPIDPTPNPPPGNPAPEPPRGVNFKINFQTADAPSPAGFLIDTGVIFGNRGNGYTYGWSADNRAGARYRKASNSPDLQCDTFNHLQNGGNFTWEVAVPDGTYLVRVVVGDPLYYDSSFRIAVEDTLIVNGAPTKENRWMEGSAVVTVTDGRLTLYSADGAVNNKVSYIEITSTMRGFYGAPPIFLPNLIRP